MSISPRRPDRRKRAHGYGEVDEIPRQSILLPADDLAGNDHEEHQRELEEDCSTKSPAFDDQSGNRVHFLAATSKDLPCEHDVQAGNEDQPDVLLLVAHLGNLKADPCA